MVKMLSMSIERLDDGKRYVVANIVADTQDEVDACGNSGDGIFGLTPNDVMVLGSLALCADGSCGMIDSQGQWKW